MNLLRELYSRREPDGVVLAEPEGRSFTTAGALAEIGRYAAALQHLGVEAGDRVSFKLEKALEVVFLAHACLQLGAILHPLNTAYTDTEIRYLLEDAEPALLVCEPEEADRFQDMAGRACGRLETLSSSGAGTLGSLAARLPRHEEIAELDRDAIAAILYTSGTTGRPKGAQITHRNLAESALALASVWRLEASDVLLHALPVYHAHGLLTSINTMLVSGGSLCFLPRFDVSEVTAALPSTTLMMGVPTHYARLLQDPGLAQAISRLRLVISGSAPLPQTLAVEFAETTGHHIIERYGSTEAAIITAVPAGTEGRTGWVGWPLPGVEVRVATAQGNYASRSASGPLETRGHNVFAGYWRRADADREAFTSDGWFVTGDIAEVDDAGCVRLLGRSKDLIISGGLNVYPSEVESVLDKLPGIAESAVFGVPHPDFGEGVAAVVKLTPGARFDEARAAATVRTKLAAYKVPKRILAVEAIPRNPMGKVLKAELRATYKSLFVPLVS